MNIYELAKLPPEAQLEALRTLNEVDAEALLHTWEFLARPEQLPPEGAWRTWVYMGGRGAGKTRAGAEWVRAEVKRGSGRIALVGQTAADVREVMLDGESGLRAVCWRGDRTEAGDYLGEPTYQPSRRRLVWANGAVAYCYSAEDPEQLRGPQHDLAWADEMGSWQRANDTWSNLQFGLRLRRSNGTPPRQLVTTTPRPVPTLRDVLKRNDTVITRGGTRRNAAFLSADFLESVESMYANTRLGKQELEGLLLDDVAGAFWTRDMFDRHRLTDLPGDLNEVVVAVDPSGAKSASDTEADEIGIIVAGRRGSARQGHAYVLADLTIRGGPAEWAKRVVDAYYLYNADCILAETNFGGALVEHTVRVEDPNVRFKMVHATRGKMVRAEPVAALYERGRVHHIGNFNQLEEQLLLFSAAGYGGRGSPDRGDALVWALTHLFLSQSGAVAVVRR